MTTINRRVGIPDRLGIYIHIPFCVSRCRYCAFYSNAVGEISVAGADTAPFADYVRRLKARIREYSDKYGRGRTADTIFIGGGTPSVLPSFMIREILDEVRDSFAVDENAEISMESNPGTLSAGKLADFRAAGVIRLSIGLQSFDDDVLKVMGRVHDAETFVRSYRAARDAGFDNINVDLMFGVPGQTDESWESGLRRLIRMDPEHISFYSLQIEEGTPFYDDYRSGRLSEISDETDRRMYHRALAVLRHSGYEHYEISNAAKPGFRCRHNMKYWRFGDYLGIGADASSFLDGVRFSEAASLDFNERPYREYHVNDLRDSMGEYMFTALRLAEGIDPADFRRRFGCGPAEAYAAEIKEIRSFLESGDLVLESGDAVPECGYLVPENGDSILESGDPVSECGGLNLESGRLRLSEKGIDISNRIMAIFV